MYGSELLGGPLQIGFWRNQGLKPKGSRLGPGVRRYGNRFILDTCLAIGIKFRLHETGTSNWDWIFGPVRHRAATRRLRALNDQWSLTGILYLIDEGNFFAFDAQLLMLQDLASGDPPWTIICTNTVASYTS